ncbi:MAG TPA: MBL fold metallo-hydrolase [Clostridiaceae bacterium]|nr:MBL fold metallo-hydrolase [Clostridiaceae bacterium]
MIVKRIVLGDYRENAYIAYDEETMEGFIVDPGDEGESVCAYVEELGVKPQFILLTHGHVDHISAVDTVRDHFGIPTYISRTEMDYIDRGIMVFGKMRDSENFVEHGDTIDFAGKKIEVIGTPGHTAGGVCFLVEGILFAGDTLFNGSIGRTDLPGGDFDQLITSIKTRLLTLPDDTVVLSGHERETTIGREKRFNGYLT